MKRERSVLKSREKQFGLGVDHFSFLGGNDVGAGFHVPITVPSTL